MPMPISSRARADALRAAPADPAPPVTRALVEDGTLALRADAALWDAVAPWVPRSPPREAARGEARAWIEVEAGAPAFALPAEPPEFGMRVGGGWLRPSGQVWFR